MVVGKVRERLAISKQEVQKSDVKGFNLKKLNEVEVRKQYHIKIQEKLEALESLNHREYINRAWENIKENAETPAKKSLGL